MGSIKTNTTGSPAFFVPHSMLGSLLLLIVFFTPLLVGACSQATLAISSLNSNQQWLLFYFPIILMLIIFVFFPCGTQLLSIVILLCVRTKVITKLKKWNYVQYSGPWCFEWQARSYWVCICPVRCLWHWLLCTTCRARGMWLCFSWLLFLIAFWLHPFSLGSGGGGVGILGERGKETSGSGRGWGGISGSGCYPLRERGAETTDGCFFVGVCVFILICVVLFVVFFTEYFYHYAVKRGSWFGQVDWFFRYNRDSRLVALSKITFFNYLIFYYNIWYYSCICFQIAKWCKECPRLWKAFCLWRNKAGRGTWKADCQSGFHLDILKGLCDTICYL